MKKITFLILLVIITANCFGQPGQNMFQPVDRKQVETVIKDSSAKTFYPSLLSRYNQFDTTLTHEDYRLLYYGFAFQDNYNAFLDQKKNELFQLLRDKKYMETVMLCDTVLDKNPFSLVANSYKGFALFSMNENDTRFIPYRQRYARLRNAILSSGDGLSCKTAFKTLFVADEYDILYNYFQVDDLKSKSFEKLCICMHIQPSKYFKSDKMYFDASETFINFQKRNNNRK